MRTAVFCDTESLYREVQARFQKRLNYTSYLAHLANYGYDVKIKVAYGNQKATVVHRFIRALNELGFQTHFNFGKDWHVEMVLDIINIHSKVDCIVLGTSEPVFAPLIPWLEAHGVRVLIFSALVPSKLSNLALVQEIDSSLLDEGKEA